MKISCRQAVASVSPAGNRWWWWCERAEVAQAIG